MFKKKILLKGKNYTIALRLVDFALIVLSLLYDISIKCDNKISLFFRMRVHFSNKLIFLCDIISIYHHFH